ncbi:MAG: M3 family oligoendopeptidase [Anaerolineae bacterium]
MDQRLPDTAFELSTWTWADVEPLVLELIERRLTASSLEEWLADWSHLRSLVEEVSARLEVAAARDTSDTAAEARFNAFREEIYNPALAAEQRIVRHLLNSDLPAPPGFETSLRRMRAGAELFREENLELLAEEQRLVNVYNRVVGAQTARWDGEEVTLYELEAELENPDRATRERAWRLRVERQRDDREALDAVWGDLLALRHQMALNAGCPDYRTFRWQRLHRFDYTPQDGACFRQSIERVAVPAACRIHERHRRCLGVPVLRPWDLEVDPLGRPPLKPFQDTGELERKATAVFDRIDLNLGATFDLMRREGLLDLENRKDKAPHGWCMTYPFVRQAFIFMNAVGWQRDVMMLLHEAGHAFHVFEMAGLPYFHQLEVPAEFLEVASMAMELLAGPYLTETEGGFYTEADAARARVKHLEDAIIVSWPYIAAMDAFQDWSYRNPDAARDGERCGEVWAEIWLRFMPGVDWSGLDDALRLSWQAIPHFFGWPLSGIEYGIAQLGAVQVWRNALKDQGTALARYRRALSLGGTVSVPKLYEAAGARFAFDVQTLKESVFLMENTIAALL